MEIGKRRSVGRPPREHPPRSLRIVCTDEEFNEIIDGIPDTRQRTLILLAAARKSKKSSRKL